MTHLAEHSDLCHVITGVQRFMRVRLARHYERRLAEAHQRCLAFPHVGQPMRQSQQSRKQSCPYLFEGLLKALCGLVKEAFGLTSVACQEPLHGSVRSKGYCLLSI